MPNLPTKLRPLAGLKKYEEKTQASVVFFVQMPENLIMYIGWTDNLSKYVVHMRQKARLYGWKFSGVYYAEIDEKYAPAVATALQRHFRPVMNKVRMKPSATDRRILKQLGLL